MTRDEMDIITSKDCGLNPNFKFGVYGNVVGDLQSKGGTQVFMSQYVTVSHFIEFSKYIFVSHHTASIM